MPLTLSFGVIGNTPGFGPGEWRFEPSRDNKKMNNNYKHTKIMSKEIAQKFENQLSKYYLQTIKDLLEEQEINPHQFMQMAVNQIKRNARLLDVFKSNPSSVFSSILTCAEFGLSPTSQMGEAWLIPYGKECQFQIGYQGLTKILYKNPDVQNITAECVYENDEFEYELGLTPKLSHKPAHSDRGKLISVYCVVRFANQDPIFKVMSVEELKSIQNLSKAGNRSVWFSKTDPQHWMLKKTVFKQLCKLLPKHLNMSKVVSYDNIVEGGGAMRLDDENNPIVIEENTETRASKFEKAMEEDNPSVEHDGMKYNPEKPKETLEYTDDKITAIEEGLDHKGEDDLPPPEDLIPLIKEDDTPEPVKEPETQETIKEPVSEPTNELEELEEFNADSIDFEQEDIEKRKRKKEAETSFLSADVSDKIDVEL